MEVYTTLVYALGFIGLFAVSFYAINLIDYSRRRKIPGEAEDKTVTIIIPAYNEEKSIARTIESALASEYPRDKLEIIVVDDGSKDNTYKIAKKFEGFGKFKIRVFTKKNGGKGSALNLAIKKSKMDIIISMDADTFIEPKTVRRMIAYFYKKKITAVTPSMGVYKAKGILQRVQQVEYYLGVFLRKSFAVTNSIHVTPGAFSAYRRSFFVKYGGYDEGNIVEDLEIGLRMQSHNYILENSPKAVVYTLVPKTLRELLIQRRRWYTGLMRNLWNYRRLFGPKKGALGVIVLPLAVVTVTASVFLTSYTLIKTLLEIKKEVVMLNSINFEFSTIFESNWYFIKNSFEKIFFTLSTNPIFLLGSFFVIISILYLHFARKKMRFQETVKISLIFFLMFYSILFTFWWIISFVYVVLNKKIIWRAEE